MDNNDILRRLRYILNYNDEQVQAVLASVGETVTKETIRMWLKREEDADFLFCPNQAVILFLDGIILKKRGPREGAPPRVEKLSNNLVLKKLKIAFSLQSDDVLQLLKNEDFRLSKHELSAFFRSPSHKHYRVCLDQVLRNFLQGLANSPK